MQTDQRICGDTSRRSATTTIEDVKGIKKRGVIQIHKLTLFGVWRHFFHESDEVEQELGVVVGQFQIIAILPGEHTEHPQVKHAATPQ